MKTKLKKYTSIYQKHNKSSNIFFGKKKTGFLATANKMRVLLGQDMSSM